MIINQANNKSRKYNVTSGIKEGAMETFADVGRAVDAWLRIHDPAFIRDSARRMEVVRRSRGEK